MSRLYRRPSQPAVAMLDDERLTPRQKVHKLTPLMADILAELNKGEPLSGEDLHNRLRRSVQAVGSSLTGLSARNLIRLERYGPGSQCVWRAATSAD